MSVKNFKHLLILVLGLGLGDTQNPGAISSFFFAECLFTYSINFYKLTYSLILNLQV